MGKWFKILIGTVLLLDVFFISIKNFLNFGVSALLFIKGIIIWFIILIGIIFLMLGLSRQN